MQNYSLGIKVSLGTLSKWCSRGGTWTIFSYNRKRRLEVQFFLATEDCRDNGRTARDTCLTVDECWPFVRACPYSLCRARKLFVRHTFTVNERVVGSRPGLPCWCESDDRIELPVKYVCGGGSSAAEKQWTVAHLLTNYRGL
jgi:hypothetical protein